MLAYGVDIALRRELIKGPGTGQLRRARGRRSSGGTELYLGLTINALNVGIALPVFFDREIDGFSGGQLLVTAIVRDGPKLLIPD